MKLTPIEPTAFVVLVIGIVVAKLRVQKLITGTEHGDAIRQHEQATEVLDLFPAKRQNFRGCALISFVTTVPTVILFRTIVIVVTALPVVFLVIRNEIVQSEAVVRVDIIYCLVGVIGV